MLYEYAVEPKAIGASWESFRYLIEKFGSHRGRLISQFPGKWIRLVIEVAKQSGMQDVRYKSLIDKLQRAKRDALISSGRDYDPDVGDWLDNAIHQHTLNPFHAIIASSNPGDKDFILVADDIDDDTPLMRASGSREVLRTGKALAEAMSLLLMSAKEVLLIDRYFNLQDEPYRETLEEFFSVISKRQLTDVSCEIHWHDHNNKRPSINYVEQNAGNWLADIMPEGMSVKIFVWQEKEKGSDFHARFLLTDIGGISIDAGFSAEGSHQKVLLTLLPYELSQEKLAAFRHDSEDYELIWPVLEISSDGQVRRI